MLQDPPKNDQNVLEIKDPEPTQQDEEWYDEYVTKTQRMMIERKQYGRICYVDPHESFPQATYYLSDKAPRPIYRTGSDDEESVSPMPPETEPFFEYDDDKPSHAVEMTETTIPRDLGQSRVSTLLENAISAKVSNVARTQSHEQNKSKDTIHLQPQDTIQVQDTMHLQEPQDTIHLQEPNRRMTKSQIGTTTTTDEDSEGPHKVEVIGKKKFGTWDGVFMNVILSVFGVIMFLRLAFVVGEAGLYNFIIILFLSTLVTSLTCLSLSAICSNGLQKDGGAYYMTSRTIGPHVGSAIGLLLSAGMSVAISSYVIGFAETMQSSIGVITDSAINDIRLYGVLLSIFLLLWTLRGVDWVLKLQYWIVLILALAVGSYLVGCFLPAKDSELLGIKGWRTGNFKTNLKPHYNTDSGVRYDFWQALSLFFPACTEILAGANIAADLRNPGQNISKGTLSAILFTSTVYLIMGIAAAGAISTDGLLGNYLCMVDIAAEPILVYMGIYAATLSSALSVQLCAPRVLMSVANDNVLPMLKIFGKTNKKGDPVAAAITCFLISVICVLIGDLNIIAPLITQFFLGTYGFISLACFVMEISHTPAWRPSYHYHNKYTALAGFILCFAMMLATSWIYALVAFGMGAGICVYVLYKKPDVYWGSALDTRAKYKANEAVLDLVNYKYHVKNYQPSFLVLTGNPQSRLPLVKFVHTLRHGHGTIVYCEVMCGKFQDKLNLLNNNASCYLPKNMKIRAFYEKIVAPNLKTGAEALMQLNGIGKLRANVLVLGFRQDWSRYTPAALKDAKPEDIKAAENPDRLSNSEYVELLAECIQYRMGFMICRGLEHIPFGDMRSGNVTVNPNALESIQPHTTIIDVWWLLDDGGLSLLIPHILSIDQFWRKLSRSNEEEGEKSSKNDGSIHTDKDSQLYAKEGNKRTLRKKQRHIVRLFLVADDNIGGDANDSSLMRGSSLHSSNAEKSLQATSTMSSTQRSKSSEEHYREHSRISAQGLVDSKVLKNIDDTTELWQAELATLLRKFRLYINGPYAIKSSRREPTKETLEHFCKLTGYDLSDSNRWNNTRLKRWLRVSELIQAYSHQQKCVFVTAPHPSSFKEPTMYLGVLDMLSRTEDKRATVLLRGHGDNVLTFYWE